MEPYLIICNSCAARLKVTNEALIGQRLACPKCQTMIEVVAPQGFKPSKAAKDAESAAADSLSGNFEDIDSLLAAAQSPKRDDRKKPSTKSTTPSKVPQKSRAATKPKLNPLPPVKAASGVERSAVNSNAAPSNPPSSESSAPIMPGAEWATESTKQKKRMLQIAMLGLLALAGLGAGTWAVLGGGGGGSTAPTVTENNESNPTIAQVDSVSTPEAVDRSISEAKQPNKAVETGDANVSQPATQTNDHESVPPPLDDPDKQPFPPSTLAPQSLVDSSAGKSAPPALPTVNPSSQRSEPEDPLPTQLLPNSASPTSANPEPTDSALIASTENSLGALSKILKGQGTSLKQIEDIAKIQKERALIGTPTYLIQRPSVKPVKVDRQLSAELTGWKLNDVPLIDAIGDLEMLSGIPVTIAPQLFRDGSIDILRPVSRQIEATSFKDAFETLLKDEGLILEPTSSGLHITSSPGADVVTESYSQSFCTNDKSTVRLKDLIIAVTGIKDWDDDALYQLDVSTDSVTVSHLQKHHKTIADLLKKLNAAAAYQSDPDTMQKTLRPLALKAEGVLAASPNLKTINPYRRSMRIGSLLRTIRNGTKLKTIIDWENLSEQGWFPNTRVPGRIDEPTNRELLNQLGHAMETTTVVIGPDTVMLTTFENAAKQRDIEVFSVGSIVDEKMKPSQLDQLITETMGVDQLTPPNATVIYFAECKCLVANAPQIIQRQLSLIVDELSSTGTP